MRKRLYSAMHCGGWWAGKRFDYTVGAVHRKQVQERYFLVARAGGWFYRLSALHGVAGIAAEDVDEGLLRFACYVAVCHTVYGQSFEYPHHRTLSSAWFPSFAQIW